jgi:hypothetical protein
LSAFPKPVLPISNFIHKETASHGRWRRSFLHSFWYMAGYGELCFTYLLGRAISCLSCGCWTKGKSFTFYHQSHQLGSHLRRISSLRIFAVTYHNLFKLFVRILILKNSNKRLWKIIYEIKNNWCTILIIIFLMIKSIFLHVGHKYLMIDFLFFF